MRHPAETDVPERAALYAICQRIHKVRREAGGGHVCDYRQALDAVIDFAANGLRAGMDQMIQDGKGQR